MKNDKIIIGNTFTPLYDTIEDRMRLVINYEDIDNRRDIMITRSFIIDLIPAIDDFILQHYGDNLIEEDYFSIDSSQRLSTQNITNTDTANLQLYHKRDELISKIDISYDKASQNSTITIITKDSMVKSVLNEIMLEQFLKSIKRKIPYFLWGISHKF